MLTFIPTPIGNLEDITLRTLKVLSEAELILAEDTRVSKKLIYLLQINNLLPKKEYEYLSFHSHTKESFFNTLSKEFLNKNVVYLTDAGMPSISDPGSELVKFCIKNGIDYDILPGPSALTTVFAASGFGDSSFLFYGFLPHKKQERLKELEKILWCGYHIVLFESPHRIYDLVSDICHFDENRELFLAKELSKIYQKYLFATAKELLEILKTTNLNGEWSLVIKKSQKETQSITLSELFLLNLPPKVLSKIVSKIKKISTKEAYEEIIKNSKTLS